MVFVLSFFTLLGLNFSFWMMVGLTRFFYEKLFPPKTQKFIPPFTELDVAAIIPAHNEESTIKDTIRALLKVLPAGNIYVINDMSSDDTLWKAAEMKVNVLNISPNVGKARGIVRIMERFDIYERYKAVIINDADVRIDRNYLKYALPLFADKKVACVAPHQETKFRYLGFWKSFFIAYRVRLWRVLQVGMRYGMTWKFTNVTYIVPGGLPLYRTSVLRKLDIDAPGLIIEDFNMTFMVHKSKLGKVAYSPKAKGTSQDPYYFNDYVKQIKRWNLGFWQSVRKNGVWPSMFWFFLSLFILEMYIYAIFVLSVPLMIFLMALNFVGINIIEPRFTLFEILIGIYLADYLLTVIVAVIEKRPIFLIYGFLFIFLRYIDTVVYIFSIPEAFFAKYSGTWVSPRREAVA